MRRIARVVATLEDGRCLLWHTNDRGYILTSTVVEEAQKFGIHETMAFSADARGEVLDWSELGSVRRDHADSELMLSLGYTLEAQL